MEVYWLEQTVADVPGDDAWLSPSEVSELRKRRFVKRRTDWLLGRWTAKNAAALYPVAARAPWALNEIEIRSAPSGAPEIFLGNVLAPIAISMSHRAGIGACAIAPSPYVIGCDLEIIEPHSNAFASDYFTSEEQKLVAKAAISDRAGLLTLLWSAKESALKALHEGLRSDTRSVIVSLPELLPRNGENNGTTLHWNPIQVCVINGPVFRGWWSQTGDLLRTVVGDPPSAPPVLLGRDVCLPLLNRIVRNGGSLATVASPQR